MEEFQYEQVNENFDMENPFHSESTSIETSTRPNTKLSTKKSADKVSNRLIICLFALCLLWSTSLQVCVAIVNIYISIPEFSSVVNDCSEGYNVVEGERRKYKNCVNEQLEMCSADLYSAYQFELLRVKTTADANTALASNFSQLVGNCSEGLLRATASFNAWTANGFTYTIPYQADCSGQRKDRVVSLIGDTTGSKTSMFAASQHFSALSDTRVAHLVTYAAELNSYNAEYLSNKTQALDGLAERLVVDVSAPHLALLSASFDPVLGAVNNAMICLGLKSSGPGTCSYGLNAREIYEDLQETLNDKLYSLFLQLRDIHDAYELFAFKMQVVMDNINKFFNAVNDTMDWIVRNSHGVFGDIVCSGSNWCDYRKVNFQTIIYSLPAFLEVPYLPDSGFIWDALQRVQVDLNLQMSLSTQGLKRTLAAMMSDIQIAIGKAKFTPDDYNPPAYPYSSNSSVEADKQADESSKFLSTLTDLLSSVANTSVPRVDVGLSFANATIDNLSGSLTSVFSTSWDAMTIAGVDVSALLATLTTVQGLFYLFDYLYRIFQTVRLVSRFWSRGVVHLPAADIRTDQTSKCAWAALGYISTAVQVLPFIWLQLLLAMVFVAFVLFSVAAVLVPEYQGYVASCVDHSANSTLLSRTMQSVAYNYAAMDGNADAARGILKYNAHSALHCSTNSFSSTQTYNAVVKDLLTKNHTLITDVSKMAEMSGCVDLSAMDSQFAEACCGQSGYYASYWAGTACPATSYECAVSDVLTGARHLPPGYYLGRDMCTPGAAPLLQYTPAGEGALAISNYMGDVQNSVFNCAALPKCEMQCVGPDRVLVAAVTRSCSCMTEWFFNGYLLQISIALAAYLLMNWSRSLICDGMIKVFWRSLAPKVFEYTANCDLEGKTLGAVAKVAQTTEQQHNIVAAYALCGGEEDGEEDDTESDYSDKRYMTGAAVPVCGSVDPTRLSRKEGVAEAASAEALLAADLQARVKSYERHGYFQILMGVLLNVPWVALVYLTQRSIAYDQGTQ